MVKNTVIAIVSIVLIAVISVSAYSYAWSRYGVFYNVVPQFPYYPNYYNQYQPQVVYPTYLYQQPTPEFPYSYPYQPYDYGVPEVAYPYSVQTSSQLCGLIDGKPYGCNYGFLCDYGKTEVQGLGVCVAAPMQGY